MSLEEEFKKSEEIRKKLEAIRQERDLLRKERDAFHGDIEGFRKVLNGEARKIRKSRVEMKKFLDESINELQEIRKGDSEMDDLLKQLMRALIRDLQGRR